MSLPYFGSFKGHIDEGLEVSGKGDCGIGAHGFRNPLFKRKSFKEM